MKVLAFSLLVLSAAMAKGALDADGISPRKFPNLLSTMMKMVKMKNKNTEVDIIHDLIEVTMFKVFDRDSDGFITLEEFEWWGLIGVNDMEIEDVVRENDIDGDGQLNYEEFHQIA